MKCKIILIAMLSSFLAACSSVPSVTNAQGQPVDFNLADYDTLDVQAFSHRVEGDDMPVTAGSGFAELVASYIRKTAIFPVADQKSVPRKSLVISGDITSFKKGNPHLREWAGFGAGTSEFFVTVYFKDAASGELLGQFQVEESSKGRRHFDLSGDEAIKLHLMDAALKITTEVVRAKQAGAPDA